MMFIASGKEMFRTEFVERRNQMPQAFARCGPAARPARFTVPTLLWATLLGSEGGRVCALPSTCRSGTVPSIRVNT